MSANYEKLQRLLAEPFHFDRADLDFGIYRITNQKLTGGRRVRLTLVAASTEQDNSKPATGKERLTFDVEDV